MIRSRHVLPLLAVLTALGPLAACADDSSPSSEGSGGDAGPAVDRELPTDEAAGEPIKLGFVNSEGGAFSVPELRVGNEVAEDYVNRNAGGIGGRPVEVVRCATDGSPERSIDCANRLVDEGVAAVLEGTDLGGDAMLPILSDAGIPLVGHVQFGPARMFDANSYYFGAAVLAYGAASLSYFEDRGAQSITWFLPDEPSSHGFTDSVLLPTAEQLGIDYKTVYYDAASPNWPVLAATAVSEDPDVSGSIAATDGQCADFIPALRDAGYQGDIFAASCGGLYDAVGDAAVGVHTDADHWNPADMASAPADERDELEEYAAAMQTYGHGDLVPGNAVITFGDLVNLQRILSTVEGPIDGAAVKAALDGTKDFDSFAGPNITCDHTVMPGNSACHTGLLFFEVQEDGSVATTTDDFLDVDALLG